MRHSILFRTARATGAAVATVAMLAACSRTDGPIAGCRLPSDGTVLAIGDSLTRGHGAPGHGYPEQLQAALPALTVLNLGQDGERSAGLRARIDEALSEHRPALVLITSGGNDFLRRVPESQTRQHLEAVLDRVVAAGAYPVLFAVPAPSLSALAGMAGEHAMFDALARRGDVHVIRGTVAEVLSDDTLKSDAIHPNRDGYARMAAAAQAVLARCP
jgi:acyl-CoA thioesterase I